MCRVTNGLLDHSFGDEAVRAGFCILPPVALLDPLLERYGPLLEDMATYIAMPWHLYESDGALTVPWGHAHSAFCRMGLLSKIVMLVPGGPGGQVDDIFSTQRHPGARGTPGTALSRDGCRCRPPQESRGARNSDRFSWASRETTLRCGRSSGRCSVATLRPWSATRGY